MPSLARRIRDRLTRKNVRWFLKCNVQSWVLQGAMVFGMSVCGVGAVAALVVAKGAAYAVFAAQCVGAARGQTNE